jgi:peptidoglycan/xylan/chitin deacetylase (PgdA/CDA1 family)
MSAPSQSTGTWGPASQRAALSLTFDNLGEAAELELGVWPADRPVGAHPSVTDVLPRILDLVDDLPATFFVEAWNCSVYPKAVQGIAERGHEVALHGWLHERWRMLGEEEEKELLERSIDAMEDLGLRIEGFRPPGGELSHATPQLLESLSFTYVSPVGAACGSRHGLVWLPFDWRAVDAYHLDPVMARVRTRLGDDTDPVSSSEWLSAAREAVEQAVREGGYRSVIFHPYLLGDDERLKVLSEFVGELRGRDDVWVAPCREVAEWLVSAEGARS